MIPIPSGNVASAIGGAYEVANSCRFNDDDSAYMHKTNGSTGSQTTWTFSCWVKRGALGTQQDIFACLDDTSNYTHLRIKSDDTVELDNISGGSNTARLTTNRKLRDVGAWYHLVWVADTTNGTAGDRIRLYINGTEETSFGTDTQPSSSASLFLNQNKKHTLGRNEYSSGSSYFDGYLAEVCFIDGTALAASSFGEFDEDSPTIWKPKDVSGLTFGTNGFYLDFEDSSNLGNDANGGTDLTEVNLAATDQASDSPTNNFCTLNPLNADLTNSTLSEGNLQFAGGDQGVNYDYVGATMAPSQGKWYWEVKAVDNAEIDQVGVAKSDLAFFSNASNSNGLQATTYGGKAVQFSNGNKAGDGSQSSFMGGFSANNILMVALDLDNGNIYFGRNGQWADGSGNADEAFGDATAAYTNLTAGAAYVPAHNMRNNGGSNAGESEYNFGSPPYANSSSVADANGYGAFEYAPPSGYYSLCTKNLAEYG